MNINEIEQVRTPSPWLTDAVVARTRTRSGGRVLTRGNPALLRLVPENDAYRAGHVCDRCGRRVPPGAPYFRLGYALPGVLRHVGVVVGLCGDCRRLEVAS